MSVSWIEAIARWVLIYGRDLDFEVSQHRSVADVYGRAADLDPDTLASILLEAEPEVFHKHASMHFIRTALIRDAALVESSFWHPRTRVLVNATGRTKEEWISKWSSEASNHLNGNEARFWVFISTETKRVTVLDRIGEGRDLALQVPGKGFAFRSDLVELLTAPMPDEKGTVTVIGRTRGRSTAASYSSGQRT